MGGADNNDVDQRNQRQNTVDIIGRSAADEYINTEVGDVLARFGMVLETRN